MKIAVRRKQSKQPAFGVTLSNVIAAGILTPPTPVFRRYKGRELEATVLADGSVQFGGTTYRTCSAAAEAARATVTGRKMNTNGWTFWQYRDGDGKAKEVNVARNEYVVKAKAEPD